MNNNEHRSDLFGTVDEWDKYLSKARKQAYATVAERDKLSSDQLKEVLSDRDRRFYRAILISKTGLYNYHMRNDAFQGIYREQLEMVRVVKPVWDEYVNSMLNTALIRSMAFESFPHLKDMEDCVEYHIAFSEYMIFLCERAGCSTSMFSIEALEMLSTMIDEGCVVAKNKKMSVTKTPSFDGWQKYFGPGKNLANMG